MFGKNNLSLQGHDAIVNRGDYIIWKLVNLGEMDLWFFRESGKYWLGIGLHNLGMEPPPHASLGPPIFVNPSHPHLPNVLYIYHKILGLLYSTVPTNIENIICTPHLYIYVFYLFIEMQISHSSINILQVKFLDTNCPYTP